MTSDQLRNIVKEIQQSEGLGIADIASRAGLDRSYFSTFINSSVKKMVTAKMLGKLTSAFPEHFPKKQQKTTATPVPDTPLPGAATLQDLIAEKEKRIQEAQEYAAKMEKHYNDMHERLKDEQQIAKEAQHTANEYLKNIVMPGLNDLAFNLSETRMDTKAALWFHQAWVTLISELESAGDDEKRQKIAARMAQIVTSIVPEDVRKGIPLNRT